MQRVERHIVIGNKNLDKICFCLRTYTTTQTT
jgi:hypothetical protein